jgi:hypothetical protein
MSLFPELERALETYFTAIQAQRSKEPPALRPVMEALEASAQEAWAEADPMLRHYLERKSYQKALDHLRGEITSHSP